MKNYILLFALATGVLVSCDTQKDEGTFVVDHITAEQMMADATFSQYNGINNADGSITYEACPDGNYIKYSLPHVNSVDIFYVKKDGSEFILSQGSNAGIFNYVPLRGSDPHQTLYFRYINADLEEVVASHEFDLQVAQELSAETKLLVSNSGEKVWGWGPDASGRVWGNAGNAGGTWDGGSIWWGCGPIGGTADGDFSGQMNHSSTGNVAETELGAHMIFNEDGSVTKCDKDGKVIGTGNFEIKDWTGDASANWKMGTLHVSNGAVLFPFMINSGGKVIEDFNISLLTADKMQLTYYETNPGEWGEATWWSFESTSDAEGMLVGDPSKSWTWGPDDAGRVWGNAGNAGGAWDGSSKWWGCGPIGGTADADFSGQMNHSSTGNVAETELGAYMTFNNDGSIVKYSKDGEKIGEGLFTIEGYTTVQTNFNQGTLKVTNGAVLFPFMINSGGQVVENFNISKLTGSKLELTYYETNPGEWGEATWWSFEAK